MAGYSGYRDSRDSRGMGDRFRGNTGNKGNTQGYPSSNTGAQAVMASIPVDYLKNGYKDASGVLDIKLLTTQAEQLGKSLGADGKTGVSKIRSFYDEVIRCLTDCTYGDMKWTAVRNKLGLLKARANTRFVKGTASKLFLDFISKNVNTVIEAKTEEEFKENLANFKDHFEAVVCYLPKG